LRELQKHRNPATHPSLTESRAEKLPLHFLILRAPTFSLERKDNFLRGRPPLAAAGGGLFQVPLFGFMYQIRQNNFKSMPRRKPQAFLRGLLVF